VRDVPAGNFAPDDGAGDDFSFVNYVRNDHHFEAPLGAQLEQKPRVTSLFVAKTKILSYKNSSDLKVSKRI